MNAVAAQYHASLVRMMLLLDMQQRQNPGRIVISMPYIFATFYGNAGSVRATYAYTLLKTPGFVWTDRTGKMRASVKIVNPGNVVVVGGASAFYAVYVEANPKFAPVRKAFQLATQAVSYSGELN